MALRFDQVEHLAEQILEGQRFDAHPFHPLTLLLVEILQLEHGQNTVAICVHAAEPVLYTGERNDRCRELQTHRAEMQHIKQTHRTKLLFLPGGIFLVLLRYEKPDELGVAYPAFSLHSAAPGKQEQQIHIRIHNRHYGEEISSSVFVYVRVYVYVSTYRVTAPENNLSMILFEEAVRGENEKNKQRQRNKWILL